MVAAHPQGLPWAVVVEVRLPQGLRLLLGLVLSLAMVKGKPSTEARLSYWMINLLVFERKIILGNGTVLLPLAGIHPQGLRALLTAEGM